MAAAILSIIMNFGGISIASQNDELLTRGTKKFKMIEQVINCKEFNAKIAFARNKALKDTFEEANGTKTENQEK